MDSKKIATLANSNRNSIRDSPCESYLSCVSCKLNSHNCYLLRCRENKKLLSEITHNSVADSARNWQQWEHFNCIMEHKRWGMWEAPSSGVAVRAIRYPISRKFSFLWLVAPYRPTQRSFYSVFSSISPQNQGRPSRGLASLSIYPLQTLEVSERFVAVFFDVLAVINVYLTTNYGA